MLTAIVEATQGVQHGFNYGKFLVGVHDPAELARRSELDAITEGVNHSLVRRCGWSPNHVWVLDLQTGEGACFHLGGLPSADLTNHGIWVCPMFEPFLCWLYGLPRADVLALRLPPLVELPDAPPAMAGYRRRGPLDPAAPS